MKPTDCALGRPLFGDASTFEGPIEMTPEEHARHLWRFCSGGDLLKALEDKVLKLDAEDIESLRDLLRRHGR